ncbi:MAG: DUF2098 domain-containing protein [Methanobacterium sp. ERen5]|nr:MAG: DUF2098 domain-containing protein [Methanobacterium sp. ERen5]
MRGIPIVKGNHVRYTNTGSSGEVTDLRSDDEGNWVLLDTTELWYKTDSLEVLKETDYLKNNAPLKSEKVNEKEGIKDKVQKSKNNFEDVDMSHELCDGGG